MPVSSQEKATSAVCAACAAAPVACQRPRHSADPRPRVHRSTGAAARAACGWAAGGTVWRCAAAACLPLPSQHGLHQAGQCQTRNEHEVRVGVHPYEDRCRAAAQRPDAVCWCKTAVCAMHTTHDCATTTDSTLLAIARLQAAT